MAEQDFTLGPQTKAVIVSVICPNLPGHTTSAQAQHSLKELTALLQTLGVEVVGQICQTRSKIDAGTIVGIGKLEECAAMAKKEQANIVVFDLDLTAGQVRQIKHITKLDVIDRCFVILEIFAQHAQTKGAKLQIEIARLEYLLPRLAGMWDHFTRQRGYRGMRSGEGEQQLEIDRRLIKEKIRVYKRQLKALEISRQEQRKKRQQDAITVALIGHTNTGKSSLLNRLCAEQVLEEDKLFATLDPTYRLLTPDTKPPLILVDTVGLIANLPSHLIHGFKSTLESARDADLLVLVCDVSDEYCQEQIEVSLKMIKDLGLEDKNLLLLLNKKDRLTSPLTAKMIKRQYPYKSLVISTFDQKDMALVRQTIIDYYLAQQEHYDLFIPYAEGLPHQMIKQYANIVGRQEHETGIFYRIRTPQNMFNKMKLAPFVLGPQDPRRQQWKLPLPLTDERNKWPQTSSRRPRKMSPTLK